MRYIELDPIGLHLAWGGGLPIFPRARDRGESATVLIRGAPGTGKSLLGSQIALSAAKELSADVVYACVEVLPTEVAEQHAAIGFTAPVLVLPFPTDAGAPPRVYAATLDLGVQGEERGAIAQAIEAIVAHVRERGGVPRVVVVDSLSDGYRLGGGAPRELADELCKLAADLGLVLVFVEETRTSDPSPWAFAVDNVLDLSLREAQDHEWTHQRWLTLSKTRFAGSFAGPHRVLIEQGKGVRVLPTSLALRSAALDKLLVAGYSPFRDALASCWIADEPSLEVRRPGIYVGPESKLLAHLGLPHGGRTLRVDFSEDLFDVSAVGGPSPDWMFLAAQYSPPDEIVEPIVTALWRAITERRPFSRVVLSGLQTWIRTASPRHWSALGSLISGVSGAEIPVLLRAGEDGEPAKAEISRWLPRSIWFKMNGKLRQAEWEGHVFPLRGTDP